MARGTVAHVLQPRHDVGHVVQDACERGGVRAVQLRHLAGEADQGPEAAEEAVQEHAEAARHRDLALVLPQPRPDDAETLAEQREVGGHVHRSRSWSGHDTCGHVTLRGEYSVIYFPIFSRSMRSFGVQSW